MDTNKSAMERGLVCCLAFAVVMTTAARASAERSVGAPVLKPTMSSMSSFGGLPLRFEPNLGQAGRDVEFVVAGSPWALLTGGSATLRGEREDVTLRFVGSNGDAKALGSQALTGKINYFSGNEPSSWRTNVATYSRVLYERLYPSVDLVYYGKGHNLEYDLIVAPGGDPAQISFELEGAPEPVVDSDGALRAGEVRLERPFVYQEVRGERQVVPSAYTVRDARVSFELGEYDRSLPLVIDPEIGYTYTLADDSKDIAIFGIAVESSGATYLAGRTRTEGAGGVLTTLVFVAKLNAEGSALVYTTSIGGSAGAEAADIAVDPAGNVYVTGTAPSSNFPTTPDAFQRVKGSPNGTSDAFVTKIGPGGDTLVYSSFLGGSGGASARDIAVDATGNAYVTGAAGSGFPVTAASQPAPGGSQDAFVTKVNAAGSAKVFSTYLGGSQNEVGSGIAVDASGNVCVVGNTSSSNFPVTASAVQPTSGGGSSEGFWAKYDAAGQRVASTYLGGSGFDSMSALAIDDSGNSFLTGETDSSDFRLVSPIQPALGGDRDVWIGAVSADGNELLLSTFYGGTRWDYGTAIEIDAFGRVTVVGATESSNFPTVDPVQPIFGGGRSDGFYIQFDPSSSGKAPFFDLAASFAGGSGQDAASGVAVDDGGSFFLGLFLPKESFGREHDQAQVFQYTPTASVPGPDLQVTLSESYGIIVEVEEFRTLYLTLKSTYACGPERVQGARFGLNIPDGMGVAEPTVREGRADLLTIDHMPAPSFPGQVQLTYGGEVPDTGIVVSLKVVFPARPPNRFFKVEAFGSALTRECRSDNNRDGYSFNPATGEYREGARLLAFSLQGPAAAPIVQLTSNITIRTVDAPQKETIGFNVYASTQPNVQPTSANLLASLPVETQSIDVSATPPGSYFIVTAVRDGVEGPPSKEVGGTLPTIAKLKVTPVKLVGQGTALATDVRIFFGGLPFDSAPKVKPGNTRAVQKGTLVTGHSISEFLDRFVPPGATIVVLFVNGNGNAVATQYIRP